MNMQIHVTQLWGWGITAFVMMAALALVIGLVLPIWAVFDCALSKRSSGIKTLLLILVILTWSVGALFYGLILAGSKALRVLASLTLLAAGLLALLVVPQCAHQASVVMDEQAKRQVEHTQKLMAGFQPASLPPTPAVEPFTAIWCRQSGIMRETAAVATLTASGPNLASARNLDPEVLQIAVDLRGEQTYGMTNHKFGRVDPATGKLTEIRMDPALASEFSWLKGIAYDEESKRIIVMCSHTETRFFSFDPAGEKWERISGAIRNLPLIGLTCAPAEGVFYALGSEGQDDTLTMIHRFNRFGAEVGRISLKPPIPMPRGPNFAEQIHMAGPWLALVLPPMPATALAEKSTSMPDEPRLLFVNPSSGDVYQAQAAVSRGQ